VTPWIARTGRGRWTGPEKRATGIWRTRMRTDPATRRARRLDGQAAGPIDDDNLIMFVHRRAKALAGNKV